MLSFPIVGIGTSAGGLEVLKEFFTAMPADSGMAFVVIQHLDPSHVSHMAEILAKFTDMRVVQADDQMALDTNSVYTIPPNKFLGLVDGMLHLTEPVKRDGVRMPIDFFFRSLAEDQREKAICVLLSGSGSDGTLGIREIRGAGGMIMAQDPETAQFDSMSRSAIATGLVDYVLPVAEMPGALIKYVQQSYVRAGNKDRDRGKDQWSQRDRQFARGESTKRLQPLQEDNAPKAHRTAHGTQPYGRRLRLSRVSAPGS